MSHKIQITVDDELDKVIKKNAHKMGLSVSSYARLALKSILLTKKAPLFEQAIKDIHSGQVESLTLDKFNRQIDEL